MAWEGSVRSLRRLPSEQGEECKNMKRMNLGARVAFSGSENDGKGSKSYKGLSEMYHSRSHSSIVPS